MGILINVKDEYGNVFEHYGLSVERKNLKPLNPRTMIRQRKINPFFALALNMFMKAIQDFEKGDEEAFYWLMGEGEYWADLINIPIDKSKSWFVNYYYDYLVSGYLDYENRQKEAEPVTLCREGLKLYKAMQEVKNKRSHNRKKKVVQKHLEECEDCRKELK